MSSSSEGGEMGEGGGSRVPRLILLIMTLAGTALLALNMAIIACFVRRRTAQNNRGVSGKITVKCAATEGNTLFI